MISSTLSRVVAVVTGAGQGLGRATAIHLASRGAKVMLVDISSEKIEQLSSEIGSSSSIFCVADVTNEDQMRSCISTVVDKWGKVNCAVSCAGIAPPMRTLSKKGVPHSLEQFSKVLQVNTVGTFNTLRLAAEAMAKNDPEGGGNTSSSSSSFSNFERGVIINTASIAAMEGQIGQAAYAASKGAVVSMTLPIARDLAPLGIRVCTIAPGLFLTPLLSSLPESVQKELASTVPFPKRLGRPEEYAQLVESIITNPMLNGEVIRLDGGLRMQP